MGIINEMLFNDGDHFKSDDSYEFNAKLPDNIHVEFDDKYYDKVSFKSSRNKDDEIDYDDTEQAEDKFIDM